MEFNLNNAAAVAPFREGVAPSGDRGRARNKEISFCFGCRSPNFGCDNRMNFPTLQNALCLACSPTRSRASSLPEGAFFGMVRALWAGADVC